MRRGLAVDGEEGTDPVAGHFAVDDSLEHGVAVEVRAADVVAAVEEELLGAELYGPAVEAHEGG